MREGRPCSWSHAEGWAYDLENRHGPSLTAEWGDEYWPYSKTKTIISCRMHSSKENLAGKKWHLTYDLKDKL